MTSSGEAIPPLKVDTSTPSPELVPSLSVLLCGGCQRAIAREDDILHERDPKAWRDHVYSYEIDLFEDGKPVWAYSATNPSARRFDLLRVATRPSTTVSSSADRNDAVVGPSSLIHVTGPYSAEHSFFVGFEWCFAACATCGHFLGWGFATTERAAAARAAAETTGLPAARAADGTDEDSGKEEASEEDLVDPVPDFFGIIVTQCTGECAYPTARYEADLAQAPHRHQVRRAVEAYRRQLVRRLNALPFTDMAQNLFLYYQHLERTLFTTGSVEVVPALARMEAVAQPVSRQRRRRRRDEETGDADPSSSVAQTANGNGAESLLPQAFDDLARIVERVFVDAQDHELTEESSDDEADEVHEADETDQEADTASDEQ